MRRVSASPDEEHHEATNWRTTNHIPFCASTMSLMLKEPACRTTPMSDRPMNTS